jgi:apoptosis-inducing factor 3
MEASMGEAQSDSTGPDLAVGVAADDIADGSMLLGHVGEASVLVARRGEEFFAISASCSHYGGPLADGILVGDTVRCPWHHACFSLRTGEALHPPAMSRITCWLVERRGEKIVVTNEKEVQVPAKNRGSWPSAGLPGKIIIVGGGAAGFAAAEKLRRERYQGSIVMLSDDDAPPVDRPNLSKDYLAGTANEDWIPLRPDDFYSANGIDLRLKARVAAIDVQSHEVRLADGTTLSYDRLLLATGAEPIRLSIPGMELAHVHTLRSFADSRAIVERAKGARRAVVLGASFIGLEVAASLRARDIEVRVVAPEKIPMERILGAQMGDFVRTLHEEHGVIFHLEDVATTIDARRVALRSGGALDADLVVAGVGVRPRIELAEKAGLAVERGVVVDTYLRTSAPDIFAAGDIARWPDRLSGENIRVEHWVVAERQGQSAALNLLGDNEKFLAVPFFWSQHYDVPINCVGHAEKWDGITIDGDIMSRDCLLRYTRDGRVLAVASIYRDVENLNAEAAMEQVVASK